MVKRVDRGSGKLFRGRPHKILKSSVAECDSTFLLAVVVTMHAAAAAIIF